MKLPKVLDFIRWVWVDIGRLIKYGRTFGEYGMTLYCGKQGAGKTIGMVWYLEEMRKKYPNVKIYTNFGYVHEDGVLDDWMMVAEIRNGDDGVIFAIDEIQTEYDNKKHKEFPEDLLRHVCMQRKQKVKIIGSAQVYTRLVVQLREQCFEVVECRTLINRWTFLRAFDAWEYEQLLSKPEKKQRMPRLWRKSFVQSDDLRKVYDTNLVIERMKKMEMLPRNERVRCV